MVVYCHTTTARLQYVIDFLSRYYGIPIQVTTDRQFYLAALEEQVNYSSNPVAENEIHIQPHGILFAKGIQAVVPDVFEYRKTSALFKTGGDFPFDLFAAVFFLLSRYEEYLPHEKDLYDRYAHTNALAFRENFLHQPVVDQWLFLLRERLLQKFPSLNLKKKVFQWVPTYDIDIAWSYRGKGLLRNAGGLLRDLSKGKWKAAASRFSVLLRGKEDPYDSYQWLQQLHAAHNLRGLFFFLVSEKTAQYDKNIDPGNERLQQLIRETAAHHTVGLHPSWQSGDEAGILEKEKRKLESIAGTTVAQSRQHYIRFTLPQTYRRLIAAGIQHDYSMGYGTINGFRASVATPFFWYDLEKEAATELMVHPFCFMDANSFYEQKKSAADAAAELQSFLHTVRSVDGTLYTIWHNNFLGTDPAFTGWRNMYEAFVRSAVI